MMIKKILAIMPSWIGDMIMAQSLFRLIKAKNPDVIIDVIAPAYSQSLLIRMPEIRRVIKAPFGHGDFALMARYRLGTSLRSEAYDQAIILPNSFKSAFIPWFANIPLRTGWRGEMRYGLLSDKRVLITSSYPKMVQRYVALGFKSGELFNDEIYWPILIPDQALLSAALEKFRLSREKPILVLCPGAAYGPSKRWPASYFSQLAEHFLGLGWSVWCIGGPDEKELVSQIQGIDLTSTSLAEAIDLMSLATVVVSNDSGLMHVASALDKPVVAIYGSTMPEHAPPLTHKARILSQSLSCKPCFKRECPFGHYHCLTQISVRRVIDAIGEIA